MSSYLERFSKWLQLKIYQIEVTLSVYIFTPAEKAIFWSIVFLLFSLTFIAIILYLPQHVRFIASRAYFYLSGDASSVQSYVSGGVGVADSIAKSAAGGSAAETAAKVVREL